jgi:hypothetical protein
MTITQQINAYLDTLKKPLLDTANKARHTLK